MRYFLAVLLCIVLYFVIFGGLGVILDRAGIQIGYFVLFAKFRIPSTLCIFMEENYKEKR
ncbi:MULTISPECIES: hypothetical protein [unclassified Treponema]|uniref:hypothetical protein n=1 Tax=unclassified Treponema TaxID=2638727 RepID=UPI0020A23AAD|nr:MULTISPECIES: hypothetical protein [unclassified Treponema]